MNKELIIWLTASTVFSFVLMADEQSHTKESTPMRMEWTARPNTQKGKIVFADTQTLPLQADLDDMIKKLTRRHRYNMKYVRASVKSFSDLKSEFDADVLVAIVDDSSTPTALIALEDHWGVVNVAKIRDTLKTQKAIDLYLEGRCVKEVLRVFSILCGGGASQYPGNIFNCARIDMLDHTEGMYPIDMQKKYHDYLSAIGVTPQVFVSYERACQEGWAPAPTNEFQKAIWDSVRALPSKPMKIEYDPAKGK